jgi:hypothetical protein
MRVSDGHVLTVISLFSGRRQMASNPEFSGKELCIWGYEVLTHLNIISIFSKELCLLDVTPCGSSKNRHFGGSILHQGDENR